MSEHYSDDRLLRPREAWERLGISRATFYRLHKSDERFPRLAKLGGASRLSERALDRYISELTTSGGDLNE